MDAIKQVYIKNREEWRKWLQENYQSEKEIWLVYYKKHTGNPSVIYVDAVEEALCFGWIDGQIKSIDEERYMQRFTPRKPSSNWSVINIDRAKKMIKEGQMTAWGRKVFDEGMKNNRIIPSSKDFSIPPDLKKALEEDNKAWSNFQSLAPSAQLVFVYWVSNAKTDKTRRKRIEETVKLSSEGKKLN
jgi:uncharacterized protein YdeI (YjbR/CyaY-like superfamily)